MPVELAETLTALVEAIMPSPGTLVVTEAEFDVPLEIGTATVDGRLLFLAGVAHSRWRGGFVPRVHLSHLRVVLTEVGERDDG